jgi:2-amino-4-hydroxy-6-hydroxymethyldihydropteridine diphosphokinase
MQARAGVRSSAHGGRGTDRLPTVTVAIALGSNLGDRTVHLHQAAARLAELLPDFRLSRLVETDPEGVGPQPRFLNAAAVATTELDARAVLDLLLAIERIHARARPFPGAPRTLDLDLILHGGTVIEEPGLVVPHPRFRERRFVLDPLNEIAPGLRDPVTGLTVQELLARLDAAG